MTNPSPSAHGGDDWLDALLLGERADGAPEVADDGFSSQVLLRISRTRAARTAAAAADIAPPAALALQRAKQRDAARSARWTRLGSGAGALLTGGVLAVSGGVPASVSWWPAALALGTALTAWALLQDAMG